uniref:Uncharacterized protein n=1 Tax=Nelumbo nucifera TaxID=4432 RepID=A0A822XW52_NELNU|nr:TPA_asm: hypothetical protein HUJ06_024793 [Nelumbo nucifera]
MKQPSSLCLDLAERKVSILFSATLPRSKRRENQ